MYWGVKKKSELTEYTGRVWFHLDTVQGQVTLIRGDSVQRGGEDIHLGSLVECKSYEQWLQACLHVSKSTGQPAHLRFVD